jgi:hypothetical protein
MPCCFSVPAHPPGTSDPCVPLLQGVRSAEAPTSEFANTTLEQEPGRLQDSAAELPNAPSHPVVSFDERLHMHFVRGSSGGPCALHPALDVP